MGGEAPRKSGQRSHTAPFLAGDKRPLEFDDALTAEALQKFAQEHGRKDDTSGEESKTEL